MNFLPPLTENARKLLNHFRANLKSADYKVARRQQWHKLVPIIDELTGRVVKAEHEAAAYQYITTSLHLSATGQLTEAQIQASPLTDAQKADCLNLARIYQAAQMGVRTPQLLREMYELGWQSGTEGPLDKPVDDYWLAVRDGHIEQILKSGAATGAGPKSE